jgi:hypothetical protein
MTKPTTTTQPLAPTATDNPEMAIDFFAARLDTK